MNQSPVPVPPASLPTKVSSFATTILHFDIVLAGGLTVLAQTVPATATYDQWAVYALALLALILKGLGATATAVLLIVGASVATLGQSACTASQLATLKTATDAAGNVCQIIVTAVDPSLPPLCTTADVIANAIESYLAASSADAGAPDAGAGVGSGAARDAVYTYVASHGGTKLALP